MRLIGITKLVLLFALLILECRALNLLKDIIADEENLRKEVETMLRSQKSMVEKLVKSLKEEVTIEDDGTGCKCVQYNCGCCLHINIPELHINDDACVNTSYLPKEYGIMVTLNIGRILLLNVTVSARNPPPICFGIPHFHDYGSMCIDFYNLDISKKSFSGCIRLEAHLIHIIVKKLDFGCFKIPLAAEDELHHAIFAMFVKELNVRRNETAILP